MGSIVGGGGKRAMLYVSMFKYVPKAVPEVF